MIAVLNYGMGNVGSILNMLKKIGAEATLLSDPQQIDLMDKLILPGVGSFDAGMDNLKKNNLLQPVLDHALQKQRPVLGICLGMQMLGMKSEEGSLPGLGLIDFENTLFSFPREGDLKIPHMGWNRVRIVGQSPIIDGLNNSERYYFVHSYHAVCKDSSNVLMTCEYGYEFTAAVYKDNIYGVQFHPEKSHEFGMRLLRNFAEKC